MHNAYRTMEYRQQEVMGASPVKLVVMTYDVAIQACEQQDFVRATKAVSLLRDALNYDYAEVAVGLFSLYQWCLDCIRKEEYTSALVTLHELRQAWVSVEKRMSPIQAQIPPLGIAAAEYSIPAGRNGNYSAA